MRLLHVLDSTDQASLPALACAGAISTLDARHTLWTIGHEGAPYTPTPTRRVSAPLRRAALAWASLRRPLRDAARSHDALVCWSPGALTAVHLACGPGRMPLVGVFTGPAPLSRATGTPGAWALRGALDRASVLCFSAHAALGWGSLGAIDVRIAPPRVPFPGGVFPARADARARLEISDDEHVVGLLADPPSRGDARRFAYLAGLLGVGGVRTVAVVHASNAQVRRALRFHRECQRAWRMIVVSTPLAGVLPACDAALLDTVVLPTHPLRAIPGIDPAPLSADALAADLARAAGVPLVVPRVPLARELTDAGHSPIIAAGDTALALASAAFAIHDQRPPMPPASEGPSAIDTLRGLIAERLNQPLPGFPLCPSDPLPPSINASTA